MRSKTLESPFLGAEGVRRGIPPISQAKGQSNFNGFCLSLEPKQRCFGFFYCPYGFGALPLFAQKEEKKHVGSNYKRIKMD